MIFEPGENLKYSSTHEYNSKITEHSLDAWVAIEFLHLCVSLISTFCKYSIPFHFSSLCVCVHIYVVCAYVGMCVCKCSNIYTYASVKLMLGCLSESFYFMRLTLKLGISRRFASSELLGYFSLQHPALWLKEFCSPSGFFIRVPRFCWNSHVCVIHQAICLGWSFIIYVISEMLTGTIFVLWGSFDFSSWGCVVYFLIYLFEMCSWFLKLP